MKKINNYIRYLLILILLKGIKVFARTSESSNQISSQTHQGSSNLLSSTTSSFINSNFFSEIIKQNIDKLEYYFINYAMPFLFVFGILYYLTKEANKEMNRPLLLIYIIIALFVTKILHDILLIPALIFIPILIIVVFYKIFRGITGSIIGFLTAIAILYGVLTNNSLKEFLSPTDYFIFLFVLFITIFILSIKIGKDLLQSKGVKQLMKHIKELSYLINKPEDIRKLEEVINKTIEDFGKFAEDLNKDIETIKEDLQGLSNPKNQQNQNQKNIQDIIEEIKKARESYNELQKAYENILNYINDIEKNINIYDEAIRPQISNFLERKKKELFDIKNSVDIKYNSILNSPRAKQIIDLILIRQISENINNILDNIKKRNKNLKEILETTRGHYEALIKEISSIHPDNYNALITSIKNLIEKAHGFLETLNKLRQEFDSEYKNILTDLENLKQSINEIPNQDKRAEYHKTVATMENAIKDYYQNFFNYYNQHQTINELIHHLRSIISDIETLGGQMDELNDYYKMFKKPQSLGERRMAIHKFNDVYNDFIRNIKKIEDEISNISTHHISTLDLSRAIEDLKANLRTAIQQLNRWIKNQHNEIEKYYYEWL